MTDWKDGVAIVTGGSNGLGAAAARSLKEQGMKIAIFDMEDDAGKAVAVELGGAYFHVDVADSDSVKAGLDGVEAQLGTPRVLVNSAGIAPLAPTLNEDRTTQDPAVITKVLLVNVVGTFNCTTQVAARMAASDAVDADGAKGAIINVSSAAAYEAPAGGVAYAASKGAVISMMLPQARDMKGMGIRINAIAPGVIETRLADALPPPVLEMITGANPFPPRIGDPAEFGNTVVYLATNAYVNADTIRLDAGLRGLG